MHGRAIAAGRGDDGQAVIFIFVCRAPARGTIRSLARNATGGPAVWIDVDVNIRFHGGVLACRGRCPIVVAAALGSDGGAHVVCTRQAVVVVLLVAAVLF